MPLHSVNPRARERILSFGGAGQGKSYDFYTIANLSVQTKSDAIFYVVDTDVSSYRMLEDPNLKHLTTDAGDIVDNLVIEDDVDDWDSLLAAVAKFQAIMRPQDWIMIDMLSPAWTWCQDAFTAKVFGQDIGDYFLQKRAAMRDPKKEKAFEGWTDWPVINQMYGKLRRMIVQSPGNVYATAEIKSLSMDQAEGDTKVQFGPYGVVPVGQKRDPHNFQTVVLKASKRPDVYEAVTIKDRGGRQKMKGKPITNFAKDYLVGTAGWKLGAV